MSAPGPAPTLSVALAGPCPLPRWWKYSSMPLHEFFSMSDFTRLQGCFR